MASLIQTSFGPIPSNELTCYPIPDSPKHSINQQVVQFLQKTELESIVIMQDEESYYLKLKNRVTKTPKNLTPKLAYFIGYFYGDGGLKNIEKSIKKSGVPDHKFKIADEFLLQINRISALFEYLFGIPIPVRFERICKGEKTYYIEMTNKIVYKFLTVLFELPSGKKDNKLKIPNLILAAPKVIRQWFIRGLFDADGDTRAVEAGFKSQSRIKIRMKQLRFIPQLKSFIKSEFDVSVNGPYSDSTGKSVYIQIERQKDIIKLHKLNLFIHPIKKWRLMKTAEFLLKRKNLKVIVAETITMGT